MFCLILSIDTVIMGNNALVQVYLTPIVTVLSTGDELVEFTTGASESWSGIIMFC